MTISALVFDPFSQEHYDNPYPGYRRLRDEAPVYYSETSDFYALSRHADVAAAFKDFETFSSSRGVTLEEIQTGDHKRQPVRRRGRLLGAVPCRGHHHDARRPEGPGGDDECQRLLERSRAGAVMAHTEAEGGDR